jgi:hypothetical protein
MNRRELRNSIAFAVSRRLAMLSTVAGFLRGQRRRRSGITSQNGRRVRLMCLVDLVQDVDLVLPIAIRARDSGRFDVTVCQTAWLNTVSPRAGSLIGAAGFEPLVVSRYSILSGLWPSLGETDVLLMASESTAPPHLVAHTLARRAKAEGVRTFVLQHGLENIGLTYRDATGDHEFASDRILTWGDPARLPAWIPGERRARCIGVGIPRAAFPQQGELPLGPESRPIIGVFENLHWDRYSQRYRASFLADLADTVAARPDLLFIVKPHHAGQWLSKNADTLGKPENLLLADPADPRWERFTASTIIERASAVITTPSTVALDAARMRRPVAVAGYELDVLVYAPLTLLRGAQDWRTFLSAALGGIPEISKGLDEFCRRHLVEGDAIAAILAALEGNEPKMRLSNAAI